ncbi:hypothetical protein AB0D27_42700 [Streptomyces sp. NPDC048415]|uniref:hypothetical protein n=1 Tax=Streptomyces sp. NPDC048415 TaxID=3154822 RepID=UPI0034226711
MLYLTVALLNMERAIAKVRFITRTQRVCVVVGTVAFLAETAGTILAWGISFPSVKPAIGCGLVLLLSAALWFGVWDTGPGMPGTVSAPCSSPCQSWKRWLSRSDQN